MSSSRPAQPQRQPPARYPPAPGQPIVAGGTTMRRLAGERRPKLATSKLGWLLDVRSDPDRSTGAANWRISLRTGRQPGRSAAPWPSGSQERSTCPGTPGGRGRAPPHRAFQGCPVHLRLQRPAVAELDRQPGQLRPDSTSRVRRVAGGTSGSGLGGGGASSPSARRGRPSRVGGGERAGDLGGWPAGSFRVAGRRLAGADRWWRLGVGAVVQQGGGNGADGRTAMTRTVWGRSRCRGGPGIGPGRSSSCRTARRPSTAAHRSQPESLDARIPGSAPRLATSPVTSRISGCRYVSVEPQRPSAVLQGIRPNA